MGAGQKSIDKATCVFMWALLLTGKYPLSGNFLRFVETDFEEEHIFRDQWDMLLDFLVVTKADLLNFNDGDAWPLLVLDFVDWLRNGCQKVEY